MWKSSELNWEKWYVDVGLGHDELTLQYINMHDDEPKSSPKLNSKCWLINFLPTALKNFIAVLEKYNTIQGHFSWFSFDAQLQTWNIIPFRIGFLPRVDFCPQNLVLVSLRRVIPLFPLFSNLWRHNRSFWGWLQSDKQAKSGIALIYLRVIYTVNRKVLLILVWVLWAWTSTRTWWENKQSSVV